MVARFFPLERDTLAEIGAADPPGFPPPGFADFAPPSGGGLSPWISGPPPESGGPISGPLGALDDPSLSPKTSMAVGAMAGVALGAAGAGLVACFVVWWIRRSLKADSSDDELFLDNLSGVPSRLPYHELKRATSNFERRLGGGAFGSVYEGTLPNGVTIAVKKLNRQIGSQDFRAEVATMGGTRHINLVRLLGFCAEGPHRLLVYEFMPNSSLDKWIFKGSSSSGGHDHTEVTLDWSQRFNIALGTARGLAYLHNECNKRIIHFDIKPQNILLDAHFVPKVADFGLSRISERNVNDSGLEMEVTTMRGTPGYFAPEYLLGMTITEKGDVYSYGLVLFELVGGKKNLDPSNPKGDTYFPATCLREVTENGFVGRTLSELIDPRLAGSFDVEQAQRLLRVAFCCIQKDPEERPHMREVVLMLEGNLRLSMDDLPSMRFSMEVQRIEVTEREVVQRQRFADYSGTAEFDPAPSPSQAFTPEAIVPMEIE